MVSFAANGIIAFSTWPLRIISRLGSVISAPAVAGGGYASYSLELRERGAVVPGPR